MKALIEKDKIVTIYPTLPNSLKVGSTFILGGSHNLSEKRLQELGIYNVVQPSYNPQTQNKGGLYFDKKKKIVTYEVTDIDFDKTYEVLEEKDGKLVGTGEFKKTYDVDAQKKSLIKDLKSKANKLLTPTDWQVIRKAERDIAIDDDIKEERAKILAEYDKKKKEVNAKKKYETLLSYDTTFFPVKLD